MRLIIAGTRTFNDMKVFAEIMDSWLVDSGNVVAEVVSGGAPGADYEGECWTRARGIPIKRFVADWATYGKAAGPIRNRQMAEYADTAVVVWDGKSRGSKNMIEEMRSLGKPVSIARVDRRWEHA